MVTGSTRGLGLAIVHVYACEGAEVVLCSRSLAELKQAVAEMTARHLVGARSQQRHRASAGRLCRWHAAYAQLFSAQFDA